MGITANTCHSADAKIKRGQFVTTVFTICKTSLLEEWNNEGTETTVNVETNVISRGECTKCDDIVLITIWEVDCGAYELSDIGCDVRTSHAGQNGLTSMVLPFLIQGHGSGDNKKGEIKIRTWLCARASGSPCVLRGRRGSRGP